MTVSSVYAYGESRGDGCRIARECTGTGCVGDLESAGGTDATTVAVVTMGGGIGSNEGAFMTPGCMAAGLKLILVGVIQRHVGAGLRRSNGGETRGRAP